MFVHSKEFIYKKAKISYLYFRKSSSKKTLVCLHGFLEYKEIFEFIYSDFEALDFSVVCIDLLGHGKSDCLGYLHTMEEQADMIYELIKELELKTITILGHSMGGYIGLAFLELYSESVDTLFLLNSSASEDSEIRKNNRLRGADLVKKNASIFIQMAISNLFDQNYSIIKANEINFLKQRAQEHSRQGIIANILGMKERKDRQFLNFQYKNIVYISGMQDSLILLDDVEIELKNSFSTHYKIFGGHMLWLENPIEIKKILKEFL